MDVEFANILTAPLGRQAVGNLENNLRDDLQVTVHEHVQRVGHYALGGILNGHDAIVGLLSRHLVEHIGDGPLRSIGKRRTEAAQGGLMGEGRFRPEIRDGQAPLQRKGARHDLAVNGPQALVGDRPLIVAENFLEHGPLPMRCIDLLAVAGLNGPDLQHVTCALVEQTHDVGVQRIDGLTVFQQGHGFGHDAGTRERGEGGFLPSGQEKSATPENRGAGNAPKSVARRFSRPNRPATRDPWG